MKNRLYIIKAIRVRKMVSKILEMFSLRCPWVVLSTLSDLFLLRVYSFQKRKIGLTTWPDVTLGTAAA